MLRSQFMIINRASLTLLASVALLLILQKSTASSFLFQLPNHVLKAPTFNSVHKEQIQNHRYFDSFDIVTLNARNKKGKVRFGSKQGMENLQGKIQRQINESVSDETDTTTACAPILIVDSNNVRGVDNFKLTNEDLIKSLASWRRYLGMPLQNIVCVVDHGCQSGSFIYDGISLVFAGPNRTADDVIAQDCHWFVKEDNGKTSIFVVTNDRELRSRCLRANSNDHDWNVNLSSKRRQQKQKPHGKGANPNTDQVQVFSSMHLSKLLKNHWDGALSNPELPSSDSKVLDDLYKVESDLRVYERPAFKNRKEKRKAHRILHSTLKKKKGENVTETSDGRGEEGYDDSEELLDAFSRPLGTQDFHERTWHRVFLAEQLRTILVQEKENANRNIINDKDVMEILSEYHSMHNSFNGHPVGMLYDQRIRNDQYAKQSLSRYVELLNAPVDTDLKSSSATTSRSSHEVPVDAADETTSGFKMKKDTQVFSTGEAVPSPAEEFMKEIVSSQGTKSQSEIIKEYSNTAPQHIQFRKTKEIRELLKKVAVKEKRPPEFAVRWYLLQES